MGIEQRIKQGLRAVTGLPSGPQTPRLRDALNRVLEVGDEVLVVNGASLFRVAEVKPVLAPGAPPNLVQLTLVLRMAVAGPHDAAVDNVYRTRHAAEIGDHLFKDEPPKEAEEPIPSAIIQP